MVAQATVRRGVRRARAQEPRVRRVTVRLSAAEGTTLAAAADRAGMALATYLCEAAMDAAEHRSVPVPKMQREMLAELIRVRGLVRRIGVNLNQAVARLNATGHRSGDLLPYAAESIRRAQLLDQAAEEIRK